MQRTLLVYIYIIYIFCVSALTNVSRWGAVVTVSECVYIKHTLYYNTDDGYLLYRPNTILYCRIITCVRS